MKKITLFALLLSLFLFTNVASAFSEDLATLGKDQRLGDFRVANLYAGAGRTITGVKLVHVPSGAPVFVMEIETVPQVFTWVDTPASSNNGLAHALEHLLAAKGTTGRYFSLLRTMRLSQSSAGTKLDFNFYGLSSGTGMDGLFEQLHALLDALYHPDFTDAEAEREFYHFGVSSDPISKRKTLIEKGSVYDEMVTDQGKNNYFFELFKSALGEGNPLGFSTSGDPDEMRGVTPDQIRRFHGENYLLGPTTGFIFVIPPGENLGAFLQKISMEFVQMPRAPRQTLRPSVQAPKYVVQPSADKTPHIYPFASGREDSPAVVLFGWEPVRAQSLVEVKLLQLLLRGLARGDGSLLYKSIVDRQTRESDWGATGLDSDVFFFSSPQFPFPVIEVSGIPGDRITREQIQHLRDLILNRIKELSQYANGSEQLRAFNQSVAVDAKSWRRSEVVWPRDAPGFGSADLKSDWKEYLEYLEGDPSFIRSISEQPVWQAVDAQLKSGINIWRGVIGKFHLLDPPYASASKPSEPLLKDLQKAKEIRAQERVNSLMQRYQTTDPQEALSRFEQDELAMTKEIAAVEARVRHPRFTAHPPLTPNDGIQYKQLTLAGGVPVISTVFRNAPTIDIGLAFDLRRLPRRYYKYLPIFPRCLDSLGLKEGSSILPYSDLMIKTQQEMYTLSIGYDSNAVSGREDFTIRTSSTSPDEFARVAALLEKMMQFNNLDQSNLDRLRDLVARRLSADAAYASGSLWILNPAYSLRHADDDLFLALSSQFTRAHWDERMRWSLHTPVTSEDINKLGRFGNDVLASMANRPRSELSHQLAGLKVDGLEKELVDYWIKNLSNFPDDNVIQGLHQVSLEVQEDLTIGPEGVLKDLRELQKIILDRGLLHVDVTADPAIFESIKPGIVRLLTSIPIRSHETDSITPSRNWGSVAANLEKRSGADNRAFPWFVGLVSADGLTGNVVFYADSPGYGQLDHSSLVKMLASKLLSGDGPQSFNMKTREAGLAYVNGIRTDPALRLMYYYADRSPDIPSLLELVKSVARKTPDLHDPFLIDYALRQTFSLPRSMLTFSQRGKALAQDIRDHNEPATIRHFSEAILKLRSDPDLLTELTAVGIVSIAPVLVGQEFVERQRSAKSILVFAGPERLLADAENRLQIPRLFRLWASDFWIP
jgi:Zn-dependent M16 (insulinase) family peptidase